MYVRLGRRGYLLAFVLPLVGLMPMSARAQGVASDFDGLHGRVLLGETVKVTDKDGVSIRGKLRRLTNTELTVAIADQERTVPAAEIAEVKARRSGPLWNGALIGAASVLIPSGIVMSKYSCGDCVPGLLIWTGIATAAGVGIDALIKGDVTVMKLAPAGAAKARVSLAPVVQRERRGVFCTISF